MAKGPHEKFALLAERLIAAHGRPLTLKKITREPADPDKPWRASGQNPQGSEYQGPAYEDSVEVVGVVVDYDEEDIDNTQILRGDRRALIAARPVKDKALEDFDVLLDGDRPLSIIKCKPLKPGTTLILYDIQVRQ